MFPAMLHCLALGREAGSSSASQINKVSASFAYIGAKMDPS